MLNANCFLCLFLQSFSWLSLLSSLVLFCQIIENLVVYCYFANNISMLRMQVIMLSSPEPSGGIDSSCVSCLFIQEPKISCFHEGIAVCEQLMGIPIPLSYTRLTSRFLVLWHLTLPVILWDDCHWIVVPATFISAASLFCIEEVSKYVSLEFLIMILTSDYYQKLLTIKPA